MMGEGWKSRRVEDMEGKGMIAGTGFWEGQVRRNTAGGLNLGKATECLLF